jgi:transposase
MSRYNLTDFEWRVIKPLLPNKREAARNYASDPATMRRF